MVNRDIRPATLADGTLLRAWVNADDSLIWKKDTENLISTTEHLAWLHSRLADPFTQIWVALHDGTPSGQVRLEKKGDFVIIKTETVFTKSQWKVLKDQTKENKSIIKNMDKVSPSNIKNLSKN